MKNIRKISLILLVATVLLLCIGCQSTENKQSKNYTNGAYLSRTESEISFLFLDEETNGFIIFTEYPKASKYRFLQGNFIRLTDPQDNLYKLYLYNEKNEDCGTVPAVMVLTKNGIKTTVAALGIIGVEFDKINEESYKKVYAPYFGNKEYQKKSILKLLDN